MPSYKDIHIEEPRTAFGQVAVSEEWPEIQIDATQGLKTQQEVETFVGTTGSVSVEYTGTGYEFKCTTGIDVGGYGLIRSQRAARYRPGQGLIMRWTARFDTPVALSTQRAGGVTLGDELSFGYNGINFGILVRTGGLPETRRLTLSAAAAGNETVTITLNGTAFNVSVTSGTVQKNAWEIAQGTFTGWNVYSNDDTVTFSAQSVDAKSGTYSVSSTGTLDGSFAQVFAGASANDTWIYQTDWNVDKLDGSPCSDFELDPSKGNIYTIRLKYLGFGTIEFFVQSPRDGRKVLVHRYQYENQNTSPSVAKPDYKIGIFAASLGSTTDLTAYSGSFYAAVEGRENRLLNPDSHGKTQTGVGTTATNIISIRIRQDINNVVNLREVIPEMITMAADGTKTVLFELILNPAFSGTSPVWQYHHENTTDSLVEIMETASTVSLNNGTSLEIGIFGLAKTGSEVVDLHNLDIDLKRGDVLCLSGKAVSGTSDLTGSIIWKER